MKRFMLIGPHVLACFMVANATADAANEEAKSRIIALDQIWGYNLPGTRDLLKIEGRSSAKQQIEEIRDALSTPPPQGKEASAGFAVAGSGADALREAHAVLVGGKKPRQTLPQDSELSLVFFSYQFGPYVHLQKVLRRGNVIEVQYLFVPHKTEEVTEHFALIPLGKLAAGKVRVEITQLPMEKRFVSAGWNDIAPEVARRIVCRPFSFVVE